MMTSNAFEKLYKLLTALMELPLTEWEKLQPLLEKQSFARNQKVLSQGAPPSDIYFVFEGLLKTSFLEKDGCEITKGFVKEGQFCAPYVSMITGTPSNFSISALENTTVLVLQFKHLAGLYQSHPCWQEISRKYAELLLVDREKREYQMLALDAEERYLEFKENFRSLVDRIPQYEMASYLGITAVALSQIKQKIRKEQFIKPE